MLQPVEPVVEEVVDEKEGHRLPRAVEEAVDVQDPEPRREQRAQPTDDEGVSAGNSSRLMS
jgi:hypothetical protein